MNTGHLRRFCWFLVTRGWDTEGQEGTRGDSLYAIVVHVAPMAAIMTLSMARSGSFVASGDGYPRG